MMFVKKNIEQRISNVRNQIVKTAFHGLTGNKGSVAIRFDCDDTSFAFLNVHLVHKQNAVWLRLENIREIINANFNYFNLAKHDYKCFFGDLNSRIDLPREEVM